MTRHLLAGALSLFLVPVPGLFAQKLRTIATVTSGTELGLNCVTPSPDGKLLALGAGDSRGGLLKLWVVANGKVTVSRKFTRQINTLVFNPEGDRLASVEGLHWISIRRVRTGAKVTTFGSHSEWITGLKFSSDGKRLCSAGWKEVMLWDIPKKKMIASFHRKINTYRGVALSRDLKLLASPNFQEIDLWDVATGKRRAILSELRGEVCCLVFSADSKTLVAASSRTHGRYKYAGQIKVWDVAKGRERATLKGRFGRVEAAALSPDGKTLAVLHLEDNQGDIELKVVEISTGRVLLTKRGENQSLHSLLYLSDGRLLVTEILDKTIKLWELAPRKK
jgi:WD40 repeat protein